MEDLPGLKAAIATVLRRVRRESSLSQQKLADFSGLSRIHIAQLEGRRQNATLNALLLIAMALNVDGLGLLTMIHEEMLRGRVRGYPGGPAAPVPRNPRDADAARSKGPL